MKIELAQNEVADILAASYSAYSTIRLHKPAFIIESLYLDFFNDLIKLLPEKKGENIIETVQQLFEKSLSDAIMEVCKVLGQHPIDGSVIWAFISERRIILRRDQQQYNRQLPGRSPKGICSDLWRDYNHWIIAINLWNGFTRSLQPSFSILIPPDAEGPIELLLSPELKPLWGMWEAYNDLGRPLFTMANCGDSIYVKPWVSLIKYRNQITRQDKIPDEK